MGWWEEQLLDTVGPPTSHTCSTDLYVDDIIGVWEHGKEKFDEFGKLANTIHPNIKVLAEYLSSTINFLNVKVTLQDNKFKTEIHTKETDQHIYVHRKSQHPTTTKNAIPCGLAIGAKRICSDKKDYHKSKKQIINHICGIGDTEVSMLKEV